MEPGRDPLKGKTIIPESLSLQTEVEAVVRQVIRGPGETSHQLEAVGVDQERLPYNKVDTTEGRLESTWSRNLAEGISRMVRNSPTHPTPVYLREGRSSGKRALEEIYPSRRELYPLVSPQSISDFPEIPEAEVEERFFEVWKQAKECAEVLSRFLDDNLQNVFDKDAFIDRHADRYFSEPQHKLFLIKAELYEFFLRNFETESFGTGQSFAAQRSAYEEFQFLPEPNVRATRYYQYFKSQSMFTDIDYIEWFQGRVKAFCAVFELNVSLIPPACAKASGEVLLQALGGPYLASYFTGMAVACWNLQTLAFAMKNPATRLKVRTGEVFDNTRMVSVVGIRIQSEEDIGDNVELIVSFMVAPGFQFGNNLIPAEVYITLLDTDPSF